MGILGREEIREEIEAILRGVFNYGAKMGRWETAETNYIRPENAFKMIEALIEQDMKGRGGECKAATLKDSPCATKSNDDEVVCPECFKEDKFIPVEACFVSDPSHGVKQGRIAPSWDEYLLWL
jgi:hypothetical protein